MTSTLGEEGKKEARSLPCIFVDRALAAAPESEMQEGGK